MAWHAPPGRRECEIRRHAATTASARRWPGSTARRIAMRTKRAVRRQAFRRQAVGSPTGILVASWEDDPGDPKSQPPLSPLSVAVPVQSAPPLPYKLSGKAPVPQVYQPGSISFVYYATASALRRTASFWGGVLPAGTKWQVGKVLPVDIDSGVDLNAFYTRGGGGESPGLHFFHASVGAVSISPERARTSVATRWDTPCSMHSDPSCSMRRLSRRRRSTSHSAT